MRLTWKVEWDERARKELRKLDKTLQKNVLRYLQERIATNEDPRRFGKPLAYDKFGLWRYRVGNVRVICHIDDEDVTILVVKVGHRKDVYYQ